MKAVIVAANEKLIAELGHRVGTAGWQIVPAIRRKDGVPLEKELPAQPDADLLILESTDPKHDIPALAARIGKPSAAAIIMLVHKRDADVLIEAMRAGVREVVSLPLADAELEAALERIAQRQSTDLSGRKPGRVIAFISCKGGSGATCIATNLAYLLAAEFGKKVALIDLDLQYGDASYFVADLPANTDISDLSRQVERLDAQLLASSMIHVVPNLHLLHAPRTPEAGADVSAPGIARIIDLARQHYDFVVLDLERTLDAVTIKALDASERIYAVMGEMVPFVRDAKRLVSALQSLGYSGDKVRLILNRHERHGQIGVGQIEKAIGLPVHQTIPNDFQAMSESINLGIPLAKHDPRNRVVEAIRGIAGELTDGHAETSANWLKKLLGGGK